MMKILSWLKSKITPEVKYVVLLFLVTRIVLSLIGVSSQMMLDKYHGQEYVWKYSDNKILDIWVVWDSGYYLNIAKGGYSTDLGKSEMTIGQANYGFFPLYPLLIKVVGFVLRSNLLAGIVVSNMALLVACFYLYKLMETRGDQKLALDAVKYLLLFPSAFILSGVFSESLFLMLLLAVFYYAKKNRWWLVGVLGFLLSLTRSIGVFVVLPLLYGYLKSKEFKVRMVGKDVLYLLLFPLGLGLFCWYNYTLTGDWLAFVHVQQSGWLHVLSNPLSVVGQGLYTKDIFRLLNSLFLVLVVAMLVVNYKKLKVTDLILSGLFIVLPLTSGVVSLNSILRYLLPIFPLYILLAKVVDKKYEQIVMAAMLLLQGFMMVFWVNGFHLIV